MTSGTFDPRLFFQRAENVALHAPAAELFGFLSRSLDLPVQWAALIRRSTGDHAVVSAGGSVESADVEDVLFVRVTPIDIALDEEGFFTRDRFQCRAEVRLRLSLIPERGELQSFLKTVVGSGRVVQSDGLANYVRSEIRTALAHLAAERDAATLADDQSAGAVSAALEKALEAPLFSAGMILDGTPIARFESKTLRQVQQTQQEAARRTAEHDAARQVQLALERAQSKHLEHLASLLTRLKGLAANSPDVELPELIRTFAERERGEVYEALFASEPVTARTQWIVVAAGDELLFVDPGNLETPARQLRVTGAVGPVRSIQTAVGADGLPVLMLGAATGVYRWPIDRTDPDQTLAVGGSPSVQGGFNAVATVGDQVFATHSELGLIEWNVGNSESCEVAGGVPRFESMTRNAKAVRAVCFFEGILYCAIDDRVICWPADESADRPTRIYTGSPTTITAVCPTADGLFAGNGDGDVLFWPTGRDTKPDRLHTGTHRAAESVWLAATSGVKRLIYTDTSLHVHARVLGDNYACRYEAGGQTLRRVEIAPDLLVATNDIRDRLICWTPGQPAQPSGVIGVSRLIRRSVQDVCLVPSV